MTSTGFAPGKVILLGEHAVVFGAPALAASLPFGLTARATNTNGGGIVLLGPGAPNDPRIAEACALIGQRVGVTNAEVDITSELPIGGGLGSSAAFAVSMVRALSGLSQRTLSLEEIGAIAIESERLFHGRPSGVDNTICAHGGVIRFWKGPPVRVERVTLACPIPIVIGFTGQRRETKKNVTSLAARVEAEPARYQPIVGRLGELALLGSRAAETGDFRVLGQQMNEAHELLNTCELSCSALEEIVGAARSAGALGAKLTGAGGGGAAIALAPDPEPVIAAIRARGYDARFAEVGGSTAEDCR
jgi:hydroxymethylglutaryl-CoA reductase